MYGLAAQASRGRNPLVSQHVAQGQLVEIRRVFSRLGLEHSARKVEITGARRLRTVQEADALVVSWIASQHELDDRHGVLMAGMRMYVSSAMCMTLRHGRLSRCAHSMRLHAFRDRRQARRSELPYRGLQR